MKFLILLAFLIHGCGAHAQLTNVQKQQVNATELTNGGFENGKTTWAASGGTFLTTTTSPMLGAVHATWDSSGAGQTLRSPQVIVKDDIAEKDAVAMCLIKVPSGTATHTIDVYDGTNVLASRSITSSEASLLQIVNFVAPDNNTTNYLQVQITSVAADEPLIAIDGCKILPAVGFNVGEASEAEFAGSAYFASTASCTWQRTNTAFGDFGTDADCPGPTIEASQLGSWQTTDADLPQWTINSLPAGVYKVEVTGIAGVTGSTGTPRYRISDGTTSSGFGSVGSSTTDSSQFKVIGYFTYSVSGNRTFKIQSATAAGTSNLYNNGIYDSPRIFITRFPLESEKTFAPDVLNWKLDLNISGANVDLGTSNQASYIAPNNAGLTMTINTDKGSYPAGISCSSTNDNTVGSTTCSAGSEELGFVANFPRAGLVEACVDFAHNITNSTSGVVSAAFQVVRTANGSQTIAESGGARIASSNAIVGTITNSLPKTCGTFQIPSAAKHTIRLMYEQSITATVTTNQLIADANASVGQRDVKITARYIDQAHPAVKFIKPTTQTFTSGSGTYTTPAGVSYIRVRLVGGGGGGAGGGASAGTGGTGGETTFGTSLLDANGGVGGSASTRTGGAGGTSSLGTGPSGIALAGSSGDSSMYAPSGQFSAGGNGGPSAFGGSGSGGIAGAGGAGVTNTGAGGGGGGGPTGGVNGAGGGSGGFIDATILNPSASYAYSVGAAGTAGTAGTSGSAGGAGGSGYIIVEEYY